MTASVADRANEIDLLMEDASQALARTAYFEAERLASQALSLTWQSRDFTRMARIVMPLMESRRQRLQSVLELGTLTVIDEPIAEGATIGPGCYLIQPPQVGADGRRLRIAALEQEIPVAVVCREPVTSLGLWPIVAIGPGVTVRTKVDPPDDPEQPDLAWFVEALTELGEFAVRSVDPGLAVQKRLEILLSRLDAIPESEALHQAIAELCREAEREITEAATTPSPPASAKSTKSKAKR